LKRILLWLQLGRAQYTPVILVPVLAGSLYAAHDAFAFRWAPLLLALAGAWFMHVGANVVNDIFDHLSGVDDAAETRESKDFGGSAVLTGGLMGVPEAVLVATGCFIAATVCGLALVPWAGSAVIWLGVAGFLLALLYVVPPAPISHLGRGLGEMAIFIAFGPLPVLGGYCAQSGQLSFGAVLASLPFGFFTTAILYNHHFTHFRGDAEMGKMSPVVVLGESRARIGSWALPALAYLSIVLNARIDEYPGWCMLGLVTAPLMGLKLARLKASNPTEAYMDLTRATAGLDTLTGLLVAAGFVISFVTGS
jgi:1,4-dihydroxy-2-naphthoate octaprenyltransferase